MKYEEVERFDPHPWIRGGIWQTIIGSQFANSPGLAQRVRHQVKVDEKSRLVLYELESSDENKPLVVMAHGMGGCSESGYMKRIANKLQACGLGVFMMNQRGSGSGMGMSERLWNGGSSDDLDKVIAHVSALYPSRSLLLVGFSLSGNILLKYLGEGRSLRPQIKGALAVNPPIDLATASWRLSYGKLASVFSRYYMRMIDRQSAALIRHFPQAFLPPRNIKTIREFDELYTAPVAGYRNVEDYYRNCSGSRFLKDIMIPTTILNSQDDPFIQADIYQQTLMSEHVDYHESISGGHMGYISRAQTYLGDHRWMDYFVIAWVKKHLCG